MNYNSLLFVIRRAGRRGLALVMMLVASAAVAAPAVVPKWTMFEAEFRSSRTYSNPIQEAALAVEFTSPAGQVERVSGFWDGGRAWRVRFLPQTAGLWSYRTICTDEENAGLHDQSGAFTCSSPLSLSPFHQHGPVRVGSGGRHLEHADGTPFFCVADTVWDGARKSKLSEWQLYAFKRADQGFNTVQWSVWPGRDAEGEYATTGFHDRIGINPEFFRRLDRKLEVLHYAGLLSAIAPVLDLETAVDDTARLPEDQAAKLVRYVVARYGAHPVLWLLGLNDENQSDKVARWKKMGRTVMAEAQAPVLLFTGDTPWVTDEFREEKWVDCLGFRPVSELNEDGLKWAVSGPLGAERGRMPARPLLAFGPEENRAAGERGRRVTPFDVRRALYWGFLMGLNAGVGYSANGVGHWDQSTIASSGSGQGSELPLWHRSLFLPGAKQVAHLAGVANGVSHAELQPRPALLAVQPGTGEPARFIAVASTADKREAVVYTPQDREVLLRVSEMPPSPVATWVNPRTGQTSRAAGVVSGDTCQFSTPEAGDWVLTLRAGGQGS